MGIIGGIYGPRVDLDTLSHGESGRFFDTIVKIKGSSGPRAKWDPKHGKEAKGESDRNIRVDVSIGCSRSFESIGLFDLKPRVPHLTAR